MGLTYVTGRTAPRRSLGRATVALLVTAMAILPLGAIAPARARILITGGAIVPAAGASNLSGTWSVLTASEDQPFERTGAALAFDPIEGLGVLFGGRAANGTFLNDTWVNDGDFPGTWGDNPNVLNSSPPPLFNAALAFDPTFNEFVLFGGQLASGAPYGGTWAFGGFVWTNLTAGSRSFPPPDDAPALAFDATLGELILVSSAVPGTTWAFAAGGWTELPSSDWLNGTANATLVADPALGGVLLFGGQTPGPQAHALNATWTFQQGGWQAAPAAPAPPPEVRPALAYDPRIPGVLLYSGTATPSTWRYATDGWAPLPGGTDPPPRTEAQLYYDSDAAYDSLFGGVAPNSTVYDDNWGWSVPPTVLTPTLGAASVGLLTWVEVGAVIAVPIGVALLLRRRPPRAKPTDAPASAAATAPG